MRPDGLASPSEIHLRKRAETQRFYVNVLLRVEVLFRPDSHFYGFRVRRNCIAVQHFQQHSFIQRNTNILGTMVIIRLIFPLDGVDHGKVRLDRTPQAVLKHLQTFVLEPMLHLSVRMDRHSGHVGLSLFRHPMQTIFRTLVVGNAPQPIVDNQMVLQMVAPHYRVFKPAFYRRIYATVGQLLVRRKPVTTDPNTSATTHHQIGTVLPAGERQVGQPFDNPPAACVEMKTAVTPRTVLRGSDIISVDDIYHHTSVLQTESLGVMPPAYRIADSVRAFQFVTDRMEHRRVTPKHVPFGRILRPTAHKQMVLTV